MTDAEKITQFAQSVYLAAHNRYFDDIEGEDGQTFIIQILDWLRQFIPELQREADWVDFRVNDYELGVIADSAQTFALPDEVRKLIVDEKRKLVILQDGSIVSEWAVVDPTQITRANRYNSKQQVTVLKRTVIFSRPLDETEIGGTVVADIANPIPVVTATDTTTLDYPAIYQLMVLGVAKNTTLPDIVQGPLSPSFAQKYANELDKATMENNTSSESDEVVREDYGQISGIGF